MTSVPKTEVPLILYKYCPPERIDIIENLQIRFSPPSEFNDAFDTYHLLAQPAPMSAKLGRSTLRNRLGVLCLAERADNHLMWVNYAKNHTGFVLGFEACAPFFQEDQRVLRKVIYQSRPPVFDAPEESACYYKSPDWEYEQEWRCVRRFAHSESRLASIEASMIKEVILGYQMEVWNISRLIQYDAALEMRAAFSASSPSHTKWKFINKPKRVSVCEHCSGAGYHVVDKHDY